MSEKSKPQSRRTFIKKTTAAVGALGIVHNLDPMASDARELREPEIAKPQNHYPWEVEVRSRARLSLHLVNVPYSSDSVLKLWNETMNSLLRRMRRRLAVTEDSEQHKEFIKNDIDTDDHGRRHPRNNMRSTYKLRGLFNNAIRVLEGLDTQPTYLDLAKLDSNNWPPYGTDALKDAMEALDTYISVPPLHVIPADVNAFLTDYAQEIADHADNYDIRELFARNKSELEVSTGGGRTAGAMFREAKRVGLLWCYPEGHRLAPLLVNGKRCVDGACAELYPEDYCQMVDGECNTMSGG